MFHINNCRPAEQPRSHSQIETLVKMTVKSKQESIILTELENVLVCKA
jgi:hypothetical protein